MTGLSSEFEVLDAVVQSGDGTEQENIEYVTELYVAGRIELDVFEDAIDDILLGDPFEILSLP
jgi:hypothetical protein